jgi:hypothetical protein
MDQDRRWRKYQRRAATLLGVRGAEGVLDFENEQVMSAVSLNLKVLEESPSLLSGSRPGSKILHVFHGPLR